MVLRTMFCHPKLIGITGIGRFACCYLLAIAFLYKALECNTQFVLYAGSKYMLPPFSALLFFDARCWR